MLVSISLTHKAFSIEIEFSAFLAGTREPIPAQEFTVVRVTIHPQFIQSNLRNDIAVLRLAAAV